MWDTYIDQELCIFVIVENSLYLLFINWSEHFIPMGWF